MLRYLQVGLIALNTTEAAKLKANQDRPVQQADGTIEGAAPQRFAGNHFSLAQMKGDEGAEAANPAAAKPVAAPKNAEAAVDPKTAAKVAAAAEPGSAKAEANEKNPEKASAEAETAAEKLVISGGLKGLPTGAAGDESEKTKGEKEAEIADAANQVRPMPAPHPIPHDKADEAESGRPLTWAERVAN
jgi:hypothetical protein